MTVSVARDRAVVAEVVGDGAVDHRGAGGQETSGAVASIPDVLCELAARDDGEAEGGMTVPPGGTSWRDRDVVDVHDGRVVDRLVVALWDDDPPPTAERTLQAYVARLRKVLEAPPRRPGTPQLLVSRAGGYAVVVEDGQLDSLQFEGLVREGRQAFDARGHRPTRT